MTTRFTCRDLGLSPLREADIQGELLVIKDVLDRNQQHEGATTSKISALEAELRDTPSEDRGRLEVELVEQLRDLAFLDAAHSMSAVGMLAPFVGSLFMSIFEPLRSDQPSPCRLAQGAHHGQGDAHAC